MKANNLDLGSIRSWRSSTAGGKSCGSSAWRSRPSTCFKSSRATCCPTPSISAFCGWSTRRLPTAYDMKGGFNDVSIGLTRGTPVEDVIRRVDICSSRAAAWVRFRGRTSSRTCCWRATFKGLRDGGADCADDLSRAWRRFCSNVVMTRLTSLQREQIAALKAFGYTNFQIAWHYMKFVLLITMFGGLVGTFGGMWLAHDFTKLFLRVYQYPELIFRVRPNVVANARAGGWRRGAWPARSVRLRWPCGCRRPRRCGRSRRPVIGRRFWNASASVRWCRTLPGWCCGNWSGIP